MLLFLLIDTWRRFSVWNCGWMWEKLRCTGVFDGIGGVGVGALWV